MKPTQILMLVLTALLTSSLAAVAADGDGGATPLEATVDPWLSEARFDRQDIFKGERFPNAVVATDGSVLATWGRDTVRVRRSEDGGKSWGPQVSVGPGIHGGGAIVDENSGDVLVFTHPKHPPRDGSAAPRTQFRSGDHGKSWRADDATFEKDTNGFLPSLHMSEHGVTLRHGRHAGRLIRPARVYRRSPDRYSTTIYSDDGGRTWQAGQPVTIQGAGEGALVELSDGALIYSARRSFFAEGQPLRHERHYALSKDGGRTWGDASVFKALPDGPR